MFAVLSIAASGLAAQSQRLEQVAHAVASAGATPSAAGAQSGPSAPVRVGALPVGSSIEESMVTLIEAEHAYRMNAAVLGTAAGMLGTLLDALDAE